MYTLMDASEVRVHTRFIESSSEQQMSVEISWSHLASTRGLGVVVALTEADSAATECTNRGNNLPCFIVREAVSSQ